MNILNFLEWILAICLIFFGGFGYFLFRKEGTIRIVQKERGSNCQVLTHEESSDRWGLIFSYILITAGVYFIFRLVF